MAAACAAAAPDPAQVGHVSESASPTNTYTGENRVSSSDCTNFPNVQQCMRDSCYSTWSKGGRHILLGRGS